MYYTINRILNLQAYYLYYYEFRTNLAPRTVFMCWHNRHNNKHNEQPHYASAMQAY